MDLRVPVQVQARLPSRGRATVQPASAAARAQALLCWLPATRLPPRSAPPQVHSSDVPEMFNMTRSLSAAFAIAVVGAGSTIFLQILADPERMNWWHSALGLGQGGGADERSSGGRAREQAHGLQTGRAARGCWRSAAAPHRRAVPPLALPAA